MPVLPKGPTRSNASVGLPRKQAKTTRERESSVHQHEHLSPQSPQLQVQHHTLLKVLQSLPAPQARSPLVRHPLLRLRTPYLSAEFAPMMLSVKATLSAGPATPVSFEHVETSTLHALPTQTVRTILVPMASAADSCHLRAIWPIQRNQLQLLRLRRRLRYRRRHPQQHLRCRGRRLRSPQRHRLFLRKHLC